MIRPYKNINPKIHATAYIEDSAQVIGDVEIGEYSSIWCNAVLRGDVHHIKLGARTNIQDNCVLHGTKGVWPVMLGNDITVGHNVTLHGCVIKDRCLIGMGSIILDGVTIGEDSIIGAGALVTEKSIIPPKSLVMGLPGKVVRQLKDEEVARILKSAKNYIEYSKEYKR
ncbi:MAG: gamma carbonic anhydrase family protein [Deltaproteobacteria bacterium RIFCSPLOWO2_12_FULL_43_16]|nr:MAG: gamma carbonic anhydrase family protein [Deltaproteobacteria bacterium GWA2_43_19]OGQ09099.1 MAG: gamma carbonic anhydrase family protein [Deltaproteobacteria bacterium RIFCSPHIGHO2_02_FULL_43_33]OGQ57646.1 MAG: gamma carbonic anhydrase family protein [Deltaproteobacteria bacterium RIFCSPLOWO2_12_FULL_43_16]HBR17931.1 gamma carbonic anhydrase family protein [Deltaproteobacteria bacterium]